jgi:hypothetical protein
LSHKNPEEPTVIVDYAELYNGSGRHPRPQTARGTPTAWTASDGVPVELPVETNDQFSLDGPTEVFQPSEVILLVKKRRTKRFR